MHTGRQADGHLVEAPETGSGQEPAAGARPGWGPSGRGGTPGSALCVNRASAH